MCQMIRMDDVVEALLDEWQAQAGEDELVAPSETVLELPAEADVPTEFELEAIRASEGFTEL